MARQSGGPLRVRKLRYRPGWRGGRPLAPCWCRRVWAAGCWRRPPPPRWPPRPLWRRDKGMVEIRQLTTLTEIAIAALVKSAILAGVLLTPFAYMTYIESQVIGYMQLRLCPHRARPLGLLQPGADWLKLLF